MQPQLSAVTVGLDGAASLGPILHALAAQTIADRIEVVAVVPAGTPAPSDEAFAAVRVVRLPELVTTGEAIAAGVRAATAPVVAYSEEHSWPREDWAERVLAVHDGRAGAVSWALENANPGSVASWVHLLSDFGPAVHPSPSRSLPALPWHHTSYRRELLTAYGADLGAMLEAEWRVHADLAKAGHPLLHAGDARSRHWNVSATSTTSGTSAAARAASARRVWITGDGAPGGGWPTRPRHRCCFCCASREFSRTCGGSRRPGPGSWSPRSSRHSPRRRSPRLGATRAARARPGGRG